MQSLVVLVFGINILAIQSRHRGLSRDGFISIQGYQTDQGHINTEEGQESIEDGTSHVDGLQDSLLIFRNGTLVGQQGATNRSSTRKPSLQQISQFPTAQNPNGIPSSTSEPPHTSPQKPTTSPSPQPEPPLPSQSSPSFFNECVYTPFFSCFDNETSSNLTGVVNDIMNVPACQVTQNSCFEPNDICCCNLKRPPLSTSQPQSEPQVPSQSETSPSNDNCNCRPRTECPEDELTEMNNRKLEKGSCEEPNHVCCHELVLPETQSIPSLGTSNLSPAPQPQSPIPSEISHSANASECICTPFYKCNDPEISSNLTELVNDRSHNQCLSSEVCCRNRIPPSAPCKSNRECISGQICIEGNCKPTCQSGKDCPELQVCQNNICVPEVTCRHSSDCQNDQRCRTNFVGQAECKAVCDGIVLCGRNAECVPEKHEAVCKCPKGYYGDPTDERIGCQKIQCELDNECPLDQVCDNYKCQVACRVKNICGDNALCISAGHKAVCFCRDGFQGDPLKGCKPLYIDCFDDNPCSPGARCNYFSGSFKCPCPPGTVGNAYTGVCEPPVECKVNADCPDTAYCGEEANIPKCKSVCEETDCGPNAECRAVNHKAVCTCIQGYKGNPDDLQTGCCSEVISCRLILIAPLILFVTANIVDIALVRVYPSKNVPASQSL